MSLKSPSRTLSHWLFATAVCVFGMVILGGLTRLTGSGLSMVDWRPITGFLPPLNPAAWQAVFDLYKESPHYKIMNFGMDLQGFKGIFWLEFFHRLAGRLIGIFFLIPLIYSLVHKPLRPIALWIVGIWIMGGLQGLMGWYMVKSGLVSDPWVSPFRLSAHLLLAFLTCSLLLWTALRVRFEGASLAAFKDLKVWIALGFLLATVIYGAFVAGMKAGLLYNTFPKMGSQWIPDELFFNTPWISNFFTNPVTVQFTHRLLGLSTLAVMWVYGLGRLSSVSTANETEKKWVGGVLAASAIQVILGISTLILGVPLDLAVAHQAGALVLLSLFLGSLFFRGR